MNANRSSSLAACVGRLKTTRMTGGTMVEGDDNADVANVPPESREDRSAASNFPRRRESVNRGSRPVAQYVGTRLLSTPVSGQPFYVYREVFESRLVGLRVIGPPT
ncbi:MAG: hypothetical protein ACKOTB_17075 [Planctomycetia bacterium]